MLRNRRLRVAEVIETTKKLDAFYKLEEDYKETSPTRGTCKRNFIFDYFFN